MVTSKNTIWNKLSVGSALKLKVHGLKINFSYLLSHDSPNSLVSKMDSITSQRLTSKVHHFYYRHILQAFSDVKSTNLWRFFQRCYQFYTSIKNTDRKTRIHFYLTLKPNDAITFNALNNPAPFWCRIVQSVERNCILVS